MSNVQAKHEFKHERVHVRAGIGESTLAPYEKARKDRADYWQRAQIAQHGYESVRLDFKLNGEHGQRLHAQFEQRDKVEETTSVVVFGSRNSGQNAHFKRERKRKRQSYAKNDQETTHICGVVRAPRHEYRHGQVKRIGHRVENFSLVHSILLIN
jgi:hypothetical protein